MTFGGMEVQFQALLIWVLDEGEWSASRSGLLPLKKQPPINIYFMTVCAADPFFLSRKRE
jgi:hypothetical protein